jgi:hypothetical protein
LTRIAEGSVVVGVRYARRVAPRYVVLLLGLTLSVVAQETKPAPAAAPAPQQSSAPAAPPAPIVPAPPVGELWDSLLKGGTIPPPDPVLTPPQAEGKASASDFREHFFFEGRSDYFHYNTQFNPGVPTVTGIVNSINTGVFNGIGYPYPSIFQPDAKRVQTVLDLGTRGWISDRIDTHITLRQDQDLSKVNPGSAAENMVETFPGNREYQLLTASIAIHGKSGDGYWSGLSAEFGRLHVYGAELASLDGAALTLDRPRFSATIYGGRRFTYYSDPAQKGIGGLNFTLKLSPDMSLEYDGLYYIKAIHSIGFRRRFSPAWLSRSYFRMVAGSPVDFNTQVMYAPGNGNTSIRVGYFQKLSNKDYFYDYTELARDRDTFNRLVGLNLGPISNYGQFMIDARRQLASRLRVGGSVWVRRLTDEKNQGPFDTSFDDYRAHAQVFPLRKTEIFVEYHQRNSDRLSPLNTTTLDNVSASGETSVKDMTGEIRRTFGAGRFGLNGGVYYRRISMQDQFFFLDGLHQSGWLAGGWWKLDSHTRIFADYNLDNDFFLFMPDLKNSRALHAGIAWRY